MPDWPVVKNTRAYFFYCSFICHIKDVITNKKKKGTKKMKYYAMKTEEGATLYFDNVGRIVDINIPDGIETITFSNEDKANKQCGVYLKSVMKQFPDVKEIKIKSSISDINIDNEMFPNVQEVASENPRFKTGPLLLYSYRAGAKGYLLRNTFCKKAGDVIDLKDVCYISPYAFSGCMSTNVINSNMVSNVDMNAFSGSLFTTLNYKKPLIMVNSMLVDINPDATEIYIDKNIHYVNYYADFSNVSKIHIDRFKNMAILRPSAFKNVRDFFIDETQKTPVYDFIKWYKRNYGECNLSSLHISKDNQYYKTVDGILYSKDGKALILCPRGKQGIVEIPEGTEYICEYAFSFSQISGVRFPDSMRRIGKFAFDNCGKLSSIDFGNGIRNIGSACGARIFSDCISLEKIDIPSQVKFIGAKSFMGCNKLKDVNLHDGLDSIGEMAFVDADINEISIPETVESLGKGSLNGMRKVRVCGNGKPIGLVRAIVKDPNLESDADTEKLSDIIEIEYENKGILYIPMYMTDESINKIDNEISVYGYTKDLAGHAYEMSINSDIKQNIAIQIYKRTKSADIAAYLKRVSATIAKRLLKEHKEEQLVEFIKTGLMTLNALKNTLKEANKVNATSVSAYILSTMDEDTSETSFRL